MPPDGIRHMADVRHWRTAQSDGMGQTVPRHPTPLFVGHVERDGTTGGFVLPTGTVTFLMTDIEGSTRAWVDDGEALATAVPRHYDILDEAIASNGGVRPVEQGEGDSVVAAFSRASDAIAAALSAQRMLGAEPWPGGIKPAVRMAVHTGEAQLRDGRTGWCGHPGPRSLAGMWRRQLLREVEDDGDRLP